MNKKLVWIIVSLLVIILLLVFLKKAGRHRQGRGY